MADKPQRTRLRERLFELPEVTRDDGRTIRTLEVECRQLPLEGEALVRFDLWRHVADSRSSSAEEVAAALVALSTYCADCESIEIKLIVREPSAAAEKAKPEEQKTQPPAAQATDQLRSVLAKMGRTVH
jgi:hypothetical protein